MAEQINRKTIDLPSEVSTEIISKTQEQSAVMRAARMITLPGRGVIVPVITGDPEAAWVGETEEKPVSNPTTTTKKMQAYKLAVIETFSNEFRRDEAALYDALIQRLPLALASKFDATVFGKTASPGENFDQLTSLTTESVKIGTDSLYNAFVEAQSAIAVGSYAANGVILSAIGKADCLKETDKMGRPLFVNSISEDGVPVILGMNTLVSRGLEDIAVVGDWTKAVFGTVEGVQIAATDMATVKTGDKTINLWQRNMFAVRAEIELGFRCEKDAFVSIKASDA